MANVYYAPATIPPHTTARTGDINADRLAIEAAFDMLPAPEGIGQSGAPYLVAGGVANVYTAVMSPTLEAYTEGLAVLVKIPVTNTLASSLNIDGLGARAIVRTDGSPTPTGTLVAGFIGEFVYNGTSFVQMSANVADSTAAANSAAAAAVSAAAAAASATTASTAGAAAGATAGAAAASPAVAAAEASAAAAAASFDSFDDRYLGAKASAPTLDNDGNALILGALYFNTTNSTLFVRDGSGWQSFAYNPASVGITGGTIVGITDLAVADGGTGASSAAAARTNLGVPAISHTHVKADITDLTPTGLVRLNRTVIAASAAAVDVIFDNTLYDAIDIFFHALIPTADSGFYLRLGDNTASTFASAGTDYDSGGQVLIGNSSTTTSGNAAGVIISPATVESTSIYGLSGHATIIGPGANAPTAVEGQAGAPGTAGDSNSHRFYGRRNAVGTHGSFRLLPISGTTFASGIVTTYGRSKT